MSMGERHAQFRPCIDLHDGQVKQIVGGTLEGAAGGLQTNFVAVPAFTGQNISCCSICI